MSAEHQGPPPHAQVMQMMMGMWVAQAAGTAARFNVADLIARGTTTADAIAAAASADPSAMYRLLRACAASGLLVETAPGSFALTPTGECLRSDAEHSLRDFLVAEMAPGHWLPWGRLYDAVRTGGPMSAETLGVPAWEYYAKNQEEGLAFARGMGNLSAIVAEDVARLYDASPFRRIVDVGGSQGVLLRALLRGAGPGARGVLFDLPAVIDAAKEAVAASPFADRIELVAGDFFGDVPRGGDLYALKSILHDWDDEKALAILRAVHRAAEPGAKLLVVETVLPGTTQPSPVAFMDLNMLVMLGGRERTASEFAQLLRDGGFSVTKVIATGGMFQLIEARRE
ncbi:MAG TPA: methyltransferase [Thermoanaerobaculia bacterium]|nr:methyltransferase [Thermoanaerobaculia bacterium]